MRRPCQHHSRIDAASQACGAASRWLLTAALIVITALTASVAAARSGDTSAALATNQVIRQFSLRNSVGMATQLLQGRVVEASGKLRGAPMGAAGAFFPNNLGSVPSGFGLPQRDGNGRPMGYCAWDNSTDSDSSSYLGGASRPQQLLYAVISPGLNGSFETNCDTVELTGQAAGDDYVEVRLASEAASQQYRSAISTVSVLNSTPGQEGDIRLVLENNRMYSFVGGAWQPITSLGPFNDNSSANGAGALTYTGGTVTVAAFEAATAALSSTLSVTGASTFNGAVTATNGLTVSGGGLNVTGNTNLTGNLNVTGTFTAGTFQGNGSGLTDLNAGNINAGILGTTFGGTGVNASAASNGALLIGNGSGFSLGTLAGTVNQVIVTNTAGGIQLSLPQNISTTSTPTFGGLMLNGPLNGTTGAFTGDVAVGGVLTGTSGTFSGNLSARRLLLADSTGGVTNPNLVIGNGALGGLPGGTGGNTVIGVGALGANSTGSNNVAFGRSAGYANASGVFANANTTGSNNTFLGAFAMPGTTTQLTYATALGSEALVTTSNTIALGRTTDTVVIGATGTATSGILQNKALQVTGNVGISGDLVIGGAFTATSFSGNGSGLTNLNAANISTGVLPVARGGTGVGTTPTNGQLLIGNGTGYALGSVSGTANQVTVNYTGGNLVLSLPQNIATASTPTFGGMALNGGLSGTTANFSGRVDAASFYAGGNQLLPITATNIRNALTPSTNSIALGTSSFAELDEGTKNTSVGYAALQGVRDGTDNAVVGYRAGYTIRDGSGNTALGSLALDTIRDGTYNTALGYSADASSDGLSYATVIGANASVSSSNTIVLGRTSDTTVIGATGTAGSGTLQGKKLQVTGDIGATGNIQIDGTFTGNGSGLTNLNAGNFTTGVLPVARGGTGVGTTPTNGQILIGNGTGYSLGSVTGTANQVTATYSGGNIALSLPQNIGTASTPTFGGMTLNGGLSGTTGSFTGTVSALRLSVSDPAGTTFHSNMAVGSNAMTAIPSGLGGNTALGISALSLNTSGHYNTAVGLNSLLVNTTGVSNTAVGDASFTQNTSGANNVAVGRWAMGSNTTGSDNVAIGRSAGWATSYNNTTNANITGSNNTFVGSYSMPGTTTQLTFATALGSDSRVNTSNTIVLGRTSDTTVIGAIGTAGSGTLLNKKLQVTGDIGATGNIQIDGTFTGNGSGLTNLNAGNFTTGVLPVARGGTGVSTASNGQLLIGTGSGFALGSITGTANRIAVTNGAGTINLNLPQDIATTSTPTFGGMVLNGGLTGTTANFSDSISAKRLTVLDGSGVVYGNTLIGFGVMGPAQSGNGANTAVGFYAMAANTSGDNNAAFGASALLTNTSGSRNTALGTTAMYGNTSGADNTAVGYAAMYNNTTGTTNTAVGNGALFGNSTGSYNAALGNEALANSSTGLNNTAVGRRAGYTNTTGSSNSFLGANADATVNNLSFATAIGANASVSSSNTIVLGRTSDSTVIGATGTAGSGTLLNKKLQVTGDIGATGNIQIDGTFTGNGSGLSNLNAGNFTTGVLPVARGGTGVSTASNGQLLIGTGSGFALGTLSAGTGISISNASGSITITNTAGAINKTNIDSALTFGTGNLTLGTSSMSTSSVGSRNTAIGQSSMVGGGSFNGTDNTALGFGALQNLSNSSVNNTAVGSYALNSSINGVRNTAVGTSALRTSQNATDNTAVGYNAQYMNLGGVRNTALGTEALYNNAAQNDIIAIGVQAAYGQASPNAATMVAIGNYAAYNVRNSQGSVALGHQALRNLTDGSANVAIGINAGYATSSNNTTNANTSGANNTFIGSYAMPGTSSQLTYATALGSEAVVSTSSTVVLGRTSDNTVIGATGAAGSGTLLNKKLQVAGDIGATGNIQIDGTFTGNGSGLTNLNAGNITTGVLPVARGGTGVTTAPTNGQILIGNGTGYVLGSITGTANRITVTNGAGTINLNLPQDIATTSTPTFGGMVLNGGLTGTTASFSGAVSAPRLNLGANTIIGNNSTLSANTTGTLNVAVGNNVLAANTTGSNNTGVGEGALANNTTGYWNTAVGRASQINLTSGYENSALGEGSLHGNSTGNRNSALGVRALFGVSTGSANTGLGHYAGDGITTGSNNTLVGASSDVTVNNLNYATALGSDALVSTSNTVVLGRISDVTVIGATGAATSGTLLNKTLQVTGDIGASGSVTAQRLIVSDGTGGVAIPNVVVGSNAMQGAASGYGGNIALGVSTLTSNTTGDYNVAINDRALTNNTTGSMNVGIGSEALKANTTGSYNMAIGDRALYRNTTGNLNVALGIRALQYVTTGWSNTAIGSDAGSTLTTGSNNTLIGERSNVTVDNLSFATSLGADSRVSTSNTVVLGRTSDNVVIGAIGDNGSGNKLQVNGNAQVTGNLNFGTSLGDKMYLWNGPGSDKYGFGVNNSNLTAFVPDSGRFSLRKGGNYNGTEVFSVDANGLVQVTTGQELRFGAFGEVSDPVFFRRINNADNRTVLQLAVGDDERTFGDVWGDEFQIGRTVDNSHNGFIPVFRVAGNGDAILSGSFTAFGLRPTAGPGTIIGANARLSNSGALVTAVGMEAMRNANNSEGVAVGFATLAADTGQYNVGLGNSTLSAKTSGNGNTGLGHFALANLSTGADNVAIGHRAGDALTSGAENTFVGNRADSTTASLVGATALGFGSRVSTNYTVVLGRTGDTTVIGATGNDGSGNKLQVSGSVKATAFNTSSDRRLKTDIRLLGDDLLDKLGGVNAYNYRFIADPYGKMRYGVIAQEVAVLFPDAVSYDAQGLMAVDYGALGAIAAAGVGKLNVRMNAMDELVKTHGTRITTLENRVQGLDDRVGSLETWRTATNTRMDTMQKAIDLNIEKIAEHALKIATNTEKITNLEKVTGEINTRLLTAEGVLDSLNKKVNTSLAKSEDGNTLTVLTPNLVASNFSAEQVRARSAYAERLEAEIARIRELEVDNLRANTATARNVRAETVNTGSAQVYAGVGNPAFLFSAPADGHYTVNTSALDGSYATATVIVNGGVAKVVPIASEGIDLIAVGNTVKAAAAGKSIKASWIKMG